MQLTILSLVVPCVIMLIALVGFKLVEEPAVRVLLCGVLSFQLAVVADIAAVHGC